jgi:hypothetical protein
MFRDFELFSSLIPLLSKKTFTGIPYKGLFLASKSNVFNNEPLLGSKYELFIGMVDGAGFEPAASVMSTVILVVHAVFTAALVFSPVCFSNLLVL